jgi:hypothetical protein
MHVRSMKCITLKKSPHLCPTDEENLLISAKKMRPILTVRFCELLK